MTRYGISGKPFPDKQINAICDSENAEKNEKKVIMNEAILCNKHIYIYTALSFKIPKFH